ncbi:MAG: FMN-binding protein [Desulfobacterales bacterium]|nr:FMN-binding protein [Desulfobacterales bacterium]MCP4162455.1 FMN-binding protein [Deltaproteobacteria bacterium]
MKKTGLCFISICALISIVLSGCTLAKYKDKIAATEIKTIDLKDIKDGEYEGFYDVYYLNAKVVVRVENNRIISIKLVEHKYDRHSGKPMIQKVIDKQSLEVDTITGATNSCKTVLKAIEIALKKGK